MASRSSSPLLPSSFDPAIYLHSSVDPLLPQSSAHSDDLEALHVQDNELAVAKNRDRVVIQHKSWEFIKGLQSDDIFSPETPSKVPKPTKASNAHFGLSLPTSPLKSTMAFSSSPLLYPPSSSPPPMKKKRKLLQTLEEHQEKKPKVVGGFLDDEDDEPELPYKPVVVQCTSWTAEKKNDSVEEPRLPTPRTSSPSELGDFDRLKKPASEGPERRDVIAIQTCSGKALQIKKRGPSAGLSYERTIAARSSHVEGKAKTSYYGIEVHRLLDQATDLPDPSRKRSLADDAVRTVEISQSLGGGAPANEVLWTEKYRATKFIDLVGDERSHRSVLRWFKSWDPVVFPGQASQTMKRRIFNENAEEKHHRKILMLTGPPGLGKTTLAHVCARQAGYEVLEINASDDRSRDVVKGRIKDALGTENVRGIDIKGKGGKTTRVAGRPVCVVVDEVDGVVSGSNSGGEGGFMKALIDLVQLDHENSGGEKDTQKRRQKKDAFRQMRPLVLICNDVYHPSLRPLRASHMAEIVHLRKPLLDKVITRMKSIFEKEGITCDSDGVRRLCEASWGVASHKDRSKALGGGEGDLRSVLVTGEWVAKKFRFSASPTAPQRLTRKWIEQEILNSKVQFDSHLKGLGRGGVREVVEKVFLEGAGLPNLPVPCTQQIHSYDVLEKTSLGITDLRKRQAISHLREMIDTCGEHDRCTTDCFATYPTYAFQDDTFLSKPNVGYDWLHFHDQLSSKVFGGQEWELNPYLGQSILAFHHLFATLGKHSTDHDRDNIKKEEDTDIHPFSGPKADFAAYEAEKQNRTASAEFQASFSAPLLRLFRSVDTISSELLPYICRILSPDVKPVVVGGSSNSIASVRKESEKRLVQQAVRAMSGLGVKFERVKVEMDNGSHGGFAFRMEPPLDTLSAFQLGKEAFSSSRQNVPVRYAVRQVLDQECRKEMLRQRSEARFARSSQLDSDKGTSQEVQQEDKENTMAQGKRAGTGVKKDFFGRVIVNDARPASSKGNLRASSKLKQSDDKRVWVSFHEGYSNAVRKPITLKELLESM